MKAVASTSASTSPSFTANYLPFIVVGTITVVAVIIFTVRYFVRERRRVKAATNLAYLDEVEDAATSGIAEDDIYNLDEFDLISLGSDKDKDKGKDGEVSTSTVNLDSGKEFSCVSLEEETPAARKISGRSMDYELTSISYGR